MLKKIIGLFALLSFILPVQVLATTENVSDNVKNIIYIECGDYTGSGVVIFDNVVLTNAHVVENENGEVEETCYGGFVENAYEIPEVSFYLTPTIVQHDDYFDYAFTEATNYDGSVYVFPASAIWGNADSMILGEEIMVLGYPDSDLAGSTITSTQGTISGFSGTNWIKSDVTTEHGNSGGGVFDALGNYIGIPTSAAIGEISSYSWIQNINAVFEDAYGSQDFVRDLDTLYERGNQVCFSGTCYYFALDEVAYPEIYNLSDSGGNTPSVVEPSTNNSPNLPDAGIYQSEKYDSVLVDRLIGRILLQVQENGEAWYVNPSDSLRYYMADGAAAYTLMRYFSLGITDANLSLIPAAATTTEISNTASICSTNTLANQLKGKILLQVEQHGEAWYVDPDTCYRIYMKDGAVAYEIMRFLSLGITNSDLEKMPSGAL
ncbi:MAG: serine protease [Candidatus Uhrbacteria bacterium]